MLRRITVVVEVLGLLAAGVFVVMLFTNKPPAMEPAPTVGTISPVQAKQLYDDACSSCHGEEGEGIYGPALSGDNSTKKYPDEKDQVAVVTKGKGQMRSFAADLTPEQIKAVVEYVRSLPTKGTA